MNTMRRHSILLLLCSPVLSARGAPAPSNNASQAPPPEEVERLAPSYCYRYPRGDYVVYTATWGFDDATSVRGCGRSLLDNVRARCGVGVEDWQCHHPTHGAAHGAKASFSTGWRRYARCVEDAVWLASPPDRRETGVECVDKAFYDGVGP